VSTHGPEHEALLERLFLGELPADAPEAARLHACPGCRDQLERLERLQRDLAAVVGRERAEIAEARAQADAGDEDLVRRALAVERRGRRAWVLVLAAAAALLATFLLRRALSVEEPAGRAPEQMLGDDEPHEAPVEGHVQGTHGPFAWDLVVPPGARFVLSVYATDGQGKGKLLLGPLELSEPAWTPSPEEERVLPDQILLEGFVRRADNQRGPPVSRVSRR